MSEYVLQKTQEDLKALETIQILRRFLAEREHDFISTTAADMKQIDALVSEFQAIRKQADKDFDKRQDDKMLTLASIKADIENFIVEPLALSHFEELNRHGLNSIRRGMITIGAESNVGKTSFMTAIAIDILRCNPDMCFICYSIDDSVYTTGKRIFSQLENRNLFYSEKLDLRPENRDLAERIIIKECFDVRRIEEQIAATGYQPRNVIIGLDYLQIVQLSSGSDKRELYNDLVKQIKDKQKELDCLFIVLSQLNRSRQGGTFTYRETSEIENQSDVCINLYPHTKKEEGKIVADLEDSRRYIKILKNKIGSKGHVFRSSITGGATNFGKPVLKDSTQEKPVEVIKNPIKKVIL